MNQRECSERWVHRGTVLDAVAALQRRIVELEANQAKIESAEIDSHHTLISGERVSWTVEIDYTEAA